MLSLSDFFFGLVLMKLAINVKQIGIECRKDRNTTIQTWENIETQKDNLDMVEEKNQQKKISGHEKSSIYNDAERLHRDLFKDSYLRLVKPMSQPKQPTLVHYFMELLSIENLDLVEGVITMHVLFQQVWTDTRLQWNPDNYAGIQSVLAYSGSVWLPEFLIINDVHPQVYNSTKPVNIFYDGKIEQRVTARVKTYCDLDLTYFPFDEQSCYIKIKSWSYDGSQLDVVPFPRRETCTGNDSDVAVGICSYRPSTEWTLKQATFERRLLYYPCCAEPYPELHIVLSVRRKRLFYVVNLLTPVLCVYLVTFVCFCIPSGSGEKISVSLSIFLSLIVFQLYLIEILPENGSSLPFLSRFSIFTMVSSFATTLTQIIVVNIRHRSLYMGRVPRSLRWFFFKVIGRILQVHPNGSVLIKIMDEEQIRDCTKETNTGGIRMDLMEIETKEEPSGLTEQVEEVNDCLACKYNKELLHMAVQDAEAIAKKAESNNHSQQIDEEWLLLTDVIDRIFLCLYILVSAIGMVSIFYNVTDIFNTDLNGK